MSGGHRAEKGVSAGFTSSPPSPGPSVVGPGGSCQEEDLHPQQRMYTGQGAQYLSNSIGDSLVDPGVNLVGYLVDLPFKILE